MGKIDLVRVTSWHRPRRLRTMSIIVIIVTITGPAVGRGGLLLNKIITFGRRTTVCLGQSPRRNRGTQTAAYRRLRHTRVFRHSARDPPQSDQRKLGGPFLGPFVCPPYAPFRGARMNTKRAFEKGLKRLRIGSVCRCGCGGNVRIWITRHGSVRTNKRVWSSQRQWKR